MQNLLKMQVGIDRETSHIYQQEVEETKAKIAEHNRRIGELT